jgi:hypothetical protein
MSRENVMTHPAIQYLNALFSKTDRVCLTFIHATKKYASGGAVTENMFLPMTDAISNEAIARLIRINEEFHVYVSMAPFKHGSRNRTKDNIAEVRHVFIEADENGDEVLATVRASAVACEIPAPTIIVQSSPHKYQFIWNVTGFTIPEQEALNRTLQQKFGGDPQATDAARVLRVAGFRNIKPRYDDPKPVAKIIEYNEPPFMGITLRDFDIAMTSEPDNTVYPFASDAVVQQSVDFLEAALNEASVSYTRKMWEGSGGAYKFQLALCPWRDNHENGGVSDAMAIVQPSGAYGFKCLHAHCADKHWKDFRKHLESLAGVELAFTEKPKPPVDETEPCAESKNTPAPSSLTRPTVNQAMFYGLAGEIIKKLEPRTEAHPVGMLVELLVSFGNVMNRNAYFQIDDTRHYTTEFMVKVGESSRARKGTGKDRIRAIMRLVDPEWSLLRDVSGVGSGEAIIQAVRDPHRTWVLNKKTGEGDWVIDDRGVDDKRLCVNMGEFQGILAACNRADSLMSVVFRDGWDGRPLKNLVKTNPSQCDEGHISVMADTTRADLTVSLNQADRNNGFANRFLWVYVWRDMNHLLPEGGGDIDWTDEVPQLQAAVKFGQQTRRMFMDESARKMWSRTLYPRLEREISGVVGAITGRASAHTLRLATLYALLDKSNHIRVEHLEAAAALWQYCEDSAQAIFGDLLSSEQTKIVDFLGAHGDSTKKQLIHDCFQRNRLGDLIQSDLDVLKSRNRVSVKDVNEVPVYHAIK